MFTNCVTVSFHLRSHRSRKKENSQVNASVFTLLAMTVERYRAIMTPLAPRNSHTTLWIGIGLVWSCSAILALPSAFASNIFVQVAFHCQGRHFIIIIIIIITIIIIVIIFIIIMITEEAQFR